MYGFDVRRVDGGKSISNEFRALVEVSSRIVLSDRKSSTFFTKDSHSQPRFQIGAFVVRVE